MIPPAAHQRYRRPFLCRLVRRIDVAEVVITVFAFGVLVLACAMAIHIMEIAK